VAVPRGCVQGGLMRALVMLALISLVTGCSTARPAWRDPNAALDISGRWMGTWIGTGLFNSPRADDVTVDLVQQGDVGYGKMVIEGTTAAESVPEEIRLQGLSGVRIFADISGEKVRLTHELGARLFRADLVLTSNDRMVGDVHGSVPGVRLVLERNHRTLPPQSARTAPPLAPVVSVPVLPPPAPVAEAVVPPPVVIVLAPPPSPEPAEVPDADPSAQRPRLDEFVAVAELENVHFGFDKAALAPDAVDVLTRNAAWLKDNDDMLVLVEGYCDERGTAEYNLALGERRAQAVMEYLAAYGIARDRVSTISYGKERPVCNESTAECMTESRRAEFRIKSR
jgi:peptidoglycan-associated lipoprotein